VHEKYADKGLLVLGFDCADQSDIALDLLRKNSLTFPTILDNSMAAVAVAQQDYHVSAVPTTYVIDREGKVAAAWIGYDKNNPRVPEELAELGLK